jgi:hypothetical protein
MKITGLSALYKQMKRGSETRCKVEYAFGFVTFDVLFLIDETPFALMFGAKAHNIAFDFKVGPGFSANPRIPTSRVRRSMRCFGLGLRPRKSV